MHRLITVLLTIFSFCSFSQITFYKQFSNNGGDFGQGIVQLEDSSYIITGASSSFAQDQTQAFLLKLDSTGNFIWSNQYGGSESDWGRRVLYAPNSGFFICGYTNSYGNGGFDFYLIKTDLNGQQEWDRTYGSSGWERVHDAALTADTGIVMVGESSPETSPGKEIYIVRTTSTGDTLWTKTIGGTGDDWAMSVEPYQDSLFIVAGTIYLEDSLKHRGFVLQINDQGDTQWIDTIGTAGTVHINDFIIIDDLLQGVGYFQSPDSTGTESMRFNYDLATSSLISLINPYDIGQYTPTLITNYGDSSRRYIGYGLISNLTEPIGQDFHIGRFNTTLGWSGQAVQVHHQGDDIGGQLISTNDGGAFAVGYTTVGNSGGANVFVLKIGPGETFPNTATGVVFEDLVAVDQQHTLQTFNLYPNPANDYITLNIEGLNDVELIVSEISGRVIYREHFLDNKTLDVRELQNGLYTVHILANEETIGLTKIIVNH